MGYAAFAYGDSMRLVLHTLHDTGSSVNGVEDECGWANDAVYIDPACAIV